MKVLRRVGATVVRAPGAILEEAKAILREGLVERNRLALVWIAAVVIILAIALSFWVLRINIAASGGWFLLLLFFLGIFLALAASVDERPTRKVVWGELGVSLLVAGLLAFAVWMVAELRRPIEEREALQSMLGFQRDMPGIDLHGKHMERFDLSGRNLEGANLSGTHLDGASLVRANLSGANLSGAHLNGANVEAADLSDTDLRGADLVGVTASRADLHEALLLDADLSDAELSGANMRGACLTDSSLAGASLPGVHLERAALTGADLDEAKFWFDLRRAFLGAVGLAGADNWLGANWPPGFDERVEELIEPRGIPPRPLVKAPMGETEVGKVLSVFDGDTVLVSTWAGRMKMRPIGINAPEFGEEGADSAREALRELLPRNRWIHFSFDRRRTDNFGRELVYLFGPGETLVNQMMLRRGAAVSQIDPPDRKSGLRNVRYARQLVGAEAWARQHARGLWETCPP